ncbi:MAG TPA: hypothetical protein VLW50_03595 [Streptosporangiaceae bacterium]|nr:hypothetical protein [Streptosporangiaceae bacterium]
MSLPAGQQRMLDGIATGLQAHDSRFATLFAIFTRLTRHEEIPGIEQLTPRRLRTAAHNERRPHSVGGRRAVGIRGRVRWIAFVPVAFIAVFSMVVIGLAVSAKPSHCGSGVAAHKSGSQGPGSSLSRTFGCQVRQPNSGGG